MHRLNEFHNGISPVNQLPPETLARIADLVCRAHRSWSDQAMTMSQVCRYWRSVVTSYPLVWTGVTVKPVTPASRVTAALKNSHELPLHVDLQIHWDKDNGSGETRHKGSHHGRFRFADSRPPPEPFANLSLLEPHHKHIRSLRILFLYHGETHNLGVTQLIQHPFFGRSFDVLDSLSLSFEDTCKDWYRRPFVIPVWSTMIKGNFPRLRVLTLSGVKRILQPNFQCPVLESLSIDFPGDSTESCGRLDDREVDFLKQHSTLTSLVVKGRVLAQPVKFHRLKSVTLSGEGIRTSIRNGVHPTSLTVMTSLVIWATDPMAILASDADGNSITYSTRSTGPLRVVETWRSYLQFAQDGVEDLYLDLYRDTNGLYDVIRELSNVKTVYIMWAGYGTKRVVKSVAEALIHPSRRSQVQPNYQKPRIGRWVRYEEDAQTAAPRDEAFKSYVSEWGLEYLCDALESFEPLVSHLVRPPALYRKSET